MSFHGLYYGLYNYTVCVVFESVHLVPHETLGRSGAVEERETGTGQCGRTHRRVSQTILTVGINSLLAAFCIILVHCNSYRVYMCIVWGLLLACIYQ